MVPSDIANVDIDAIVDRLTIDEATSLIAGVGWWNTAPVPRLGVPTVKLSDGPNGLRGKRFFNGSLAQCIPCGTGLGSTWDVELVRELGARILAPEAKRRAASVVLGPTVNTQRSPLGGRSFESFAEDPVLNGTIAAAYINGVQNEGIGCTIKHLVCNDQENERHGSDSIVSARALREVYLLPFMIAQRDAKPWAVMTAYSSLNGTHASENPALLQGILRGDWGFNGLVMSDWWGTYSLDLSVKSGVDLEMPGLRNWRTPALTRTALSSHKILPVDVKSRAREVLKLVKLAAKHNPDVVNGDGAEKDAIDSADDRALLRRAAASSVVLLRNEGVLPLQKDALKSVAIIGPNAKTRVISGGGSAQIRPLYTVSPYEGIVGALGKSNVRVEYAEGTRAFKSMPVLDEDIWTPEGKRGFRMEYYNHSDPSRPDNPDPTPFKTHDATETAIIIDDVELDGLTPRFTLRLRGSLTQRDHAQSFEFGLTVAGRGRLFVNEVQVIDIWNEESSEEKRKTLDLRAGHPHVILVEYTNIFAGTLVDSPSVRLGGAPVVDADAEIICAEDAAKRAEVAIVVVGLNADWESEGYDRTDLGLPGRTNELVSRVAKANPRTIVVNQSGSAVTMPWANEVAAILQAWYGGNSAGDGIADVLFGAHNPSARLSMTFPHRLEDVPSFLSFGGKNGPVIYAEDLFVGYKYYIARKVAPLFAFGHGLSYTTFAYSDLKVSEHILPASLKLSLSLLVKNTGRVPGAEVVQVYIALPPHPQGESQPEYTLRGFARANDIAVGELRRVNLHLDKYAFSAWDVDMKSWVVRAGTYEVLVGSSSVDIRHRTKITVEKAIHWTGL